MVPFILRLDMVAEAAILEERLHHQRCSAKSEKCNEEKLAKMEREES